MTSKRNSVFLFVLLFLVTPSVRAQNPGEWAGKQLTWTNIGLSYGKGMGLARTGLGTLEEGCYKFKQVLLTGRLIESYALAPDIGSLSSGLDQSSALDQLYELGLMGGYVYGSGTGHLSLSAGIGGVLFQENIPHRDPFGSGQVTY